LREFEGETAKEPWLLLLEDGLLRFLRAQVTDGDNGDKQLRRNCLERR
jgi:hypothetical protein